MKPNSTKIAKTVGLRIQAMRGQRKLSQAQVATTAHVTRTTVSEIEKGSANPSMETLMRICGALGMNLSELFLPAHFDDQKQIILQPINGSLYQALKKAIESGEYTACQMLVAYAKSSGVDLIAHLLLSMRKSGGIVKAYIGIDQKNTTAEALYKLLHVCNELYVTHDEAVTQTYHPKLYMLTNSQCVWTAVGSNNLTRGGLFTNYEACAIQNLNLSLPQNSQLYKDIQDAVGQYHTASLVKRIYSTEDIQQLLNARLIVTEQESRMGLRRSSVANPSSFGHRPVHDLPDPSYKMPVPTGIFVTPTGDDSALPQTPSASAPKTTLKGGDSVITAQAVLSAERGLDIQETYWFCTGKLTGGSRNILDLSEGAVLRGGAPSKIAKGGSMPGGVSLFGLDPKDHGARKDLTIIYNDMPYRFSTIKYTPGNSNWRFQLKGRAETGKASLSQFGGDFVNRILLFHKLSDDCYILEVMEGSELSVLKAHSSFWATNGKMKNGRPFGVLAI